MKCKFFPATLIFDLNCILKFFKCSLGIRDYFIFFALSLRKLSDVSALVQQSGDTGVATKGDGATFHTPVRSLAEPGGPHMAAHRGWPAGLYSGRPSPPPPGLTNQCGRLGWAGNAGKQRCSTPAKEKGYRPADRDASPRGGHVTEPGVKGRL